MQSWPTSSDEQNQYFIDGPGRLKSALQLLPAKPEPPNLPPPLPPPTHQDHPVSYFDEDLVPTNKSVLYSSSNQDFSSKPFTSSMPKTIVASDNEISNGFVRDGKRLPYVFEANESGTRKRSSKILPVCGVCGKKFVCVTTMKRHLVTHTGEKPFSCKICGKQYTQKGNLRVHERTHRNDRPFECNICHQKFYRKEPMQKHQWRQHGIAHFKARPPTTPVPTTPTAVAPIPAPSHFPTTVTSTSSTEGILYNSIVDQIKSNSEETYLESSRDLNGPSPPPPYNSHEVIHVNKHQEQQQDENLPKNAAIFAAAALNMTTTNNNNNIMPSSQEQQQKSLSRMSKFSDNTNNYEMAKFSAHIVVNKPKVDDDNSSTRLFSGSSKDILSSSSSVHAVQAVRSLLSLDRHLTECQNEVEQPSNPLTLKKKFAHAYQKDLELQNKSQENLPESASPNEFHHINENLSEMKLQAGQDSSTEDSLDDPELERVRCDKKEIVECQCRSCGNIFTVSNPFNFLCTHCNIKYTSLPTHMITDPLQCIGCCQVFPHKPGLKAHQTCPDKERPFKCCKCGYGFRQKAHLQKHQWGIHRRKLGLDQNVKDAEAILHAIKDCHPVAQKAHSTTTITIQDVIDRSVEHSMSKAATSSLNSSNELNKSQPLDLSPHQHLASSCSSAPFSIKSDQEMTKPNLSELVALMPAFSPREGSPDIRVIRESNPLLNQRPTLPMLTSNSLDRVLVPPSASIQSPSSFLLLGSNPIVDLQSKPTDLATTSQPSKKLKTTVHNNKDTTMTHKTRPPITLLQKPTIKTLFVPTEQKTTTAPTTRPVWLSAGAKKFIGLPKDNSEPTDLTTTTAKLTDIPSLTPTPVTTGGYKDEDINAKVVTLTTKDLVNTGLIREQRDIHCSQNLRTV